MKINTLKKITGLFLYFLLNHSISIFSQYYPGGLSNSNYIVWLDANDANNITVVGGKVSQWTDKSGAGTTISQATAADRPVYTANQINGMPIVQTDGSTTFLQGTYNVDGLTEMSMLAVATPSTITSTLANPYSVNYPICYWGMETAGWGQVGLNLNNVSTLTFYNFGWRFGTSQASSDVFYNPPTTPSGAKVMAVAHNNTVERGYYNGFNITTPVVGYSLTGKLATIANCPNTFYVGHGQTPYGGNGFGGNNMIGEIMIYNTSLSNTQLIILQNYLAAKWGVTMLANQHFSPPTATTYNYNLVGVGMESSSDSVRFTRSTDGMGFLVPSPGFFQNNGDYMMAAHTNPLQVNVSTANLPSGTIQSWADEWYVQKTDVGNNGGNISIFFNSTAYGISITFGAASNYQLLYRATSGATTYSVISTATATVSGSAVYFSVNATNIANGYYTLGTNSAPLPIELTDFTAQCQNNNVAINWTTATQTNNDYFNVEKSTDAVSFSSIAKIQGAGTSSNVNNYSFIDKNPYNGESYYRLQQTDYNGQSKTFNTVSVNCAASTATENVYNNNQGSVVISIQASQSDNYTIKMYDVLGKTVISKLFNFEKGNSTNSIDISFLNAGIYFITLENNSTITTHKIIVK